MKTQLSAYAAAEPNSSDDADREKKNTQKPYISLENNEKRARNN